MGAKPFSVGDGDVDATLGIGEGDARGARRSINGLRPRGVDFDGGGVVVEDEDIGPRGGGEIRQDHPRARVAARHLIDGVGQLKG
ncbi:MAG: hypothetical protein LUO93_05810 [Methanomicrobiales archaeon]|nr:hypothetical protein [Methanomicrobiales archaeon]